jgi:hypothetical protein
MAQRSGALNVACAVLVLGVAACGPSTPTAPAVAIVSFTYESRFGPSCPASGNVCYASCAHHLAPGGLQVLVPLWGPEPVRMAEAGPNRWRAELAEVPVNVPLRLYVQDIQGCCMDPCGTGPQVTQDVFANGFRLTRVVRDGLPAGVEAAVQFRLTPEGIE